jgi:NADH-quinone oxidoreductase subunit M
MESTGLSLVTVVLFLPMIGFTILLFIPESQSRNIRYVTLGTSLVTFALSLLLWAGFNPNDPALQMVQRWDWLPDLGISYYVGIDGLNLMLVLLTTLIMPIAILASFSAHIFQERGREKLYYLFMLLLEWAMIGVFVTQDLIIFYIFWEITLVPMYFMVGIWGGEKRVYAAVKFFLYTMAGSILMLLAILYVGLNSGTFASPEIAAGVANGSIVFPYSDLFSPQAILFLGFFIAFAIKVPMWPFHSWLPDAHVQAPTAGSVILAAILLKMGAYGMIRFCLPLFPDASVGWAPIIAGLAVIGIIYGGWVSYAQTDMKKLVAYSSVSHMGFILLGIFALTAVGIQGSLIQMVNHGISTGGLFLIVGFLYERRHTKDLAAYGGLWKTMPLLGAISLIIVLSSMGLPGLNGFIGEFTILLGSMGSQILGFFFTLFAAIGIILAAIYMLNFFQRIFAGEVTKEENRVLPKLEWNEITVMVPIVVLAILIGIQPYIFMKPSDTSVSALVAQVEPAIAAVTGESADEVAVLPESPVTVGQSE